MKLVQVALQEQHRKQGGKQHLRTPHHLVHTGCDTQQSDVHQHSGDQVEEGRDSEQKCLLEAALGNPALVEHKPKRPEAATCDGRAKVICSISMALPLNRGLKSLLKTQHKRQLLVCCQKSSFCSC